MAPLIRSPFLDFDYCPRLRDMLQSGQAELPNGEIVSVHATSTLNNLRVIRHFILLGKLKSTLEIGLAFGASALAFLASLAEVNVTGFNHTAIDPYQASIWKSAAIHNIKSEGMANHFTYIAQESALALPELYTQGKKYNLIYIDGSHLFEDVFIDFFYSYRLLETNGLILFDDCTDKHIRKVIRFIDRNFALYLRRENLSTIVQKSIMRRIANQLGVRQLVVYRKIGEPPRKWNTVLRNF